MHVFNVLLQSSLRVALEKEHDKNKAAIRFFFFFNFYQNADGTRVIQKKKFHLKLVEGHHAIWGIKFEHIKTISIL